MTDVMPRAQSIRRMARIGRRQILVFAQGRHMFLPLWVCLRTDVRGELYDL